MQSSRRQWIKMAIGTSGLVISVPAIASTRLQARKRPKPYGTLPSKRQLAWHQRDRYAFVHFTINTFTDREWGYGDEPESLFNPSDFSADQIVSAAKSGGLIGLILTAKHHDGFCLWPTAFGEHSVKNSPYKGGRGDIVGEIATACKDHGLAFGIYLSPWDRNHAEYGRAAYVEYYHNQLRELTTQYGPLFEVWFDGANGGDGYYGGAREKRQITQAYYQWDKVREIVRKNQPDAVMFADEHMDIRWVGNEEGHAGDPCWPTVDATPYTQEKGNKGVRGGVIWNPAETNVSIRPGWFWHEDEIPRSPANLTKVYFESVGRGTTLLLNLAPDRRGRVPDADVAALQEWKVILDKTFAHNLAKDARVTASSQFSKTCSPVNILMPGLWWAAKETDRAGAWIQFDLPKAVTFDVVRVSEDIRLGMRIDDYTVEVWKDGAWTEIARRTAIGYERLIRLASPVTSGRVRLRILTAAASPVLNHFGLFLMPDVVEEAYISRDAQGLVSLYAVDKSLEAYYTLDESKPTTASIRYSTPFALPDGGIVKAILRKPGTQTQSAITSQEFDVVPARWQVLSATGTAPETLIKGGTFMGLKGQPVEIILDLAQTYDLKGFTLKPPVHNIFLGVDIVAQMGAPAGYEVWVSDDGKTWGASMAKGEFSNIAANRTEQRIRFKASKAGRYLRFVFAHAVQDKPIIAFNGIGIITR